MRKRVLALAATAVLGACSDNGEVMGMIDAYPESEAAMMDYAGEAMEEVGNVEDGAAAPSTPMLAYIYNYGIEAPADHVDDLMGAHEQACRAAGAAVCQVTGSNIRENYDGRIMGELSLRAQPAWLTGFRGGLEGDAEAAGGRLTSSSTETRDLTRDIIDTEARLRARTTLRDRLQDLLASRPGDLEELLDLERELARVQGEIDSAQSTLAVMRQRVETSELSISYVSQPSFAAQGAWAPVGDALRGAQGVMASSIAGLILAVAALLPLTIIIGGIVWLILRWRRRRKALKPGSQEKAA